MVLFSFLFFSLWFWFLFPWLMMLSIFSRAYRPLAFLPWRQAYSDPLPIVLWYVSFYHWVVRILYIFWTQALYHIYDLQIFSPLLWLSFHCLYSNHFLLDNCSFIYRISLFAAIFHLFFCYLFVRLCVYTLLTFSWWLRSKESACQCRRCVWSLGQEDPLEEGMATHSSPLAWKIPWTEESGRLQSMGSQRVRHNLVIEHMCTL